MQCFGGKQQSAEASPSVPDSSRPRRACRSPTGRAARETLPGGRGLGRAAGATPTGPSSSTTADAAPGTAGAPLPRRRDPRTLAPQNPLHPGAPAAQVHLHAHRHLPRGHRTRRLEGEAGSGEVRRGGREGGAGVCTTRRAKVPQHLPGARRCCPGGAGAARASTEQTGGGGVARYSTQKQVFKGRTSQDRPRWAVGGRCTITQRTGVLAF